MKLKNVEHIHFIIVYLKDAAACSTIEFTRYRRLHLREVGIGMSAEHLWTFCDGLYPPPDISSTTMVSGCFRYVEKLHQCWPILVARGTVALWAISLRPALSENLHRRAMVTSLRSNMISQRRFYGRTPSDVLVKKLLSNNNSLLRNA